MTKLTKMKASVTHTVIAYGGPKSGKTYLAGKLAEHYKIIIIDMESGSDTLFQLPEEWQDRVEVISIPDTRSYPMAIETCLKIVKGPCSVCVEHGKVGCMVCKRAEKSSCENVHEDYFTDIDVNSLGSDTIVIFETLTQISNSAIANITKGESDDYKLNYDDWGNLGKLLDIFLSHIQQASYNVIVTSHEIEAETEGKKKQLVPIGGTRNFSMNVPKYFGHCVYVERKNKKHICSSSSTYSTAILTGSRAGVAIEDYPSMGLLPIFKPELCGAPEVKVKPKIGEGSPKKNTSDLLAKLRNKDK